MSWLRIAVIILFAIILCCYLYRVQIALNQSGAKGLAENPRHIDLDRITDEFLLIGLRPDEDVIGRKAHDPL